MNDRLGELRAWETERHRDNDIDDESTDSLSRNTAKMFSKTKIIKAFVKVKQKKSNEKESGNSLGADGSQKEEALIKQSGQAGDSDWPKQKQKRKMKSLKIMTKEKKTIGKEEITNGSYNDEEARDPQTSESPDGIMIKELLINGIKVQGEDEGNDDENCKKQQKYMSKKMRKQPCRDNENIFLDTFIRKANIVQENIEKITLFTRQITDLNEKLLLSITTKEENDATSAMHHVVANANKYAIATKKILDQLKEENEEYKEAGGANSKLNDDDIRMRVFLCDSHTKKFINATKSYQGAQKKFEADLKSKIKRQIKIIKSDATDEEIDNFFRNEQGVERMYRERLLKGEVPNESKTVYGKAAGKYQDIVKIEQSIAVIQQLFLDMAIITELQGEVLDNIEYQVHKTVEDLEGGNKELHTSIKTQKKIRKKQVWIAGIVLSVILITIIVLL